MLHLQALLSLRIRVLLYTCSLIVHSLLSLPLCHASPPPSFHMPPVREVSDLNLCEAAKAAEAEAFAAAGVCEGGGAS